MNYRKIYCDLMSLAKDRNLNVYTEIHHIVPKSIGGSDETQNLVALTAREHYVAHWLLFKFSEGRDKHKMAFAFFALAGMKNKHQKREFTSRQYERAKLAMLDACKTRIHHKALVGRIVAHKDGVEKWFKDTVPLGWIRGRSPATKKKISTSRKGASNVWSSGSASAAGKIGAKGKFWWFDPETGEEARSVDQPGPSFIRGSRKWFNDGTQSKQFIQGFEPSGWSRGRIMNWKRNQLQKSP